MAYKKVSIPKNNDGAGTPVIKDPTIYIVDVADIDAEPTRELGNTVTTGDLTLKAEAKAIAIYATPSTIEYTEEPAGEVDGKGIMQGVTFEHPGDSVEIKNFLEAFMNRGVVIIQKECDGTGKGRQRLFGSKCNPLYMTIETMQNKDGHKRKFIWKQIQVSKFVAGEYGGALPAVAPDASAAAAASVIEGA